MVSVSLFWLSFSGRTVISNLRMASVSKEIEHSEEFTIKDFILIFLPSITSSDVYAGGDIGECDTNNEPAQ